MNALLLVCFMGWIVALQVVAVGRDHTVPLSQGARVTTALLALATAIGTVPRLLELIT